MRNNISSTRRLFTFFFFCQGVTTAADWSQLRKAPSSWAELEDDNIILTVPSAFVRHMEAPETLMGLWRDMMKGVADLAAIPNKLLRKERIVTDVQISHGKWMNEPINTLLNN